MNTLLRSIGHGETIAVDAAGRNYELALDGAMYRAGRMVATTVHRDFEDAKHGDWWVLSSQTSVNLSGTQVSGTFVFQRKYEQPDE